MSERPTGSRRRRGGGGSSNGQQTQSATTPPSLTAASSQTKQHQTSSPTKDSLTSFPPLTGDSDCTSDFNPASTPSQFSLASSSSPVLPSASSSFAPSVVGGSRQNIPSQTTAAATATSTTSHRKKTTTEDKTDKKVSSSGSGATKKSDEVASSADAAAAAAATSQDGSDNDHLQRLHQRQKQILFGKATASYVNYLCEIPISKRDPNNQNHPVTPRIDLRNTKRQFDASVRAWRRGLHVWDVDSMSGEHSCADSTTESRGDHLSSSSPRAAASSSLMSSSQTGVVLSTTRHNSIGVHPVLFATYKQSIRNAAEQLQGAVRTQFPSSVQQPSSASQTGSNDGAASTSSHGNNNNNNKASSSRSPASSAFDTISEAAAAGGSAGGGGGGGTTTEMDTADFVCHWLQRFDEAAINAEASLLSSECPPELPSSAFSVASSSDQDVSTSSAGGGGGSSSIRSAGRRVVPVVKASVDTSNTHRHHQQHLNPNNASSNTRRGNSLEHRGGGDGDDDLPNAQDEEVDVMKGLLGNLQPGVHRPLKLSSLASSDTPSHLVLKMYEKQLPQIEFAEGLTRIAGRSGSPMQLSQQHAARVQISPLNSRVSQWVSDHSPTPESEHHPLRSLHSNPSPAEFG